MHKFWVGTEAIHDENINCIEIFHAHIRLARAVALSDSVHGRLQAEDAPR